MKKLPMTPTRAVQTFIDCSQSGKEIPKDALETIRRFKEWSLPELMWLNNSSAYCPEIMLEPGMEEKVRDAIGKIKSRDVEPLIR